MKYLNRNKLNVLLLMMCIQINSKHFFVGDPRINQHFGITSYSIMFTRFHNVIAHKLQEINSQWSDEVLYQEARKFVGALNQIIVYRDYLPILLGIYYFENYIVTYLIVYKS